MNSTMSCRTSLLLPSALRGFLFALVLLALCFPVHGAFAGGSSPEPFSVGLRTFGVWEPDTNERFDFSVWYPSRTASSENELEGWLVKAGKRGRIVQGFFPLVLLSHDTMGGRFAHNDIAAALAAAGMIVIAPTHSGDNQNSGSGLYKVETLRSRPLNMIRALETVLASPDFAPYVDESRIGVLGFGAGALTALQLAGATPDFSNIDAYCRTVPIEDAYCVPWAQARLSVLHDEMDRLLQDHGRDYFTPSLGIFAPELMAVAIPPELIEKHASDTANQRKSGFWHRLFGSDDEDESHEELVESAASSASDEKKDDETALHEAENQDAGESLADAAENAPGVDQTQGATDSQPDDEMENQVEAATPSPRKVNGTLVFHRPAGIRIIRGIAMAAPAGGMLFTRESLARVTVPLAIVEAGKNTLYPTEYHAVPYMSRLPLLPLRLSFPEADHFSLFAACSKDSLNTLNAICGRIRGEEREALSRERDAFLVSFFQSVLGGPLPLPPPSGFAAVADPEEAP